MTSLKDCYEGEMGSSEVSGKVVVVAVKASRDISKTALVWALTHVVQPGDCIKLLVVIPATSSGRKVWSLSRYTTDCATSHWASRLGTASDQKEVITNSCSQLVLQLHDFYDPDKIKIRVKILSGSSCGAVAAEAKRVQSSWIILDRKVKHEKKYCMEELHCNIVVMKRSHPKILRLNLNSFPKIDLNRDCPLSLEPNSYTRNLKEKSEHRDRIKGPAVTPASSPESGSPPLTATDVGTSSISSSDPWTSPFFHSDNYERRMRSFPFVHEGLTNLEVESDSESEKLSLSSKSSYFQPWIENVICADGELHEESIQSSSDKALISTYEALLQRFTTKLDQDPILGALNCKIDMNFSKSVREAISLAKSAAPGSPPLCSICQHKAPVFGNPPRWFTFAELQLATSGFSQENFLAEGGFGSVHRGVLPDGQIIAVKQYKLASTQGDKEFCSEVEVLSCAQHRNVVMLIGFCVEVLVSPKELLTISHSFQFWFLLLRSSSSPSLCSWPLLFCFIQGSSSLSQLDCNSISSHCLLCSQLLPLLSIQGAEDSRTFGLTRELPGQRTRCSIQDMGCIVSSQKDSGGNRRKPGSIGEVSVNVPGLRIPKPVDFAHSLGDCLSKSLVERLSALRTRIVVMAGQEGPTITRTKRKSATQHGGSTLADLLQALEDYLPVLLGLVKDGSHLQFKVQFVWVNQEDDAEETAMSNAWYEVLSVLHLMAMLLLSQANLLLLPRTSSDGYQPKVTEENRRASVDIFLKSAGYLDCAVKHVLPQLPEELRRNLPVDLAEGVLRALCLQALGQGVDIQLGMAIDSAKATLAVKRRLACEMVKYWQQAQDNIMNLPLANGWGKKHILYVKWKHVEAKSAAYYYHGMILDEGNTEKSQGMAVAALEAADDYFKESKKLCEAFNVAPPLSRNPPLWGTMKYLSEKIPKDTSSKVRVNRDLYSHERIMETAPTLPDFALALKPDEYQLPPVSPSWTENVKGGLTGAANHLKG